MQYNDQQKYLDTLRRYEKKFDKKELEEYKMFVKRQKDEEDFDRLSFARLKELYQKYYMNREKKNYDHLFQKPDQDEKEAG